MDIKEITQEVEKESYILRQIMAEMEKVIVGQRKLMERMLIGLICEGHIMLEGLPGLAKTTAVKTLAAAIKTSFQRIQFTPDLLPADILGTQIYRPDNASFEIKKGPIFHNIILADEINRAPAKVQSALLEAMQERQVTIGDETFPLDRPFLVLATQNPIGWSRVRTAAITTAATKGRQATDRTDGRANIPRVHTVSRTRLIALVESAARAVPK